MDQNDYDKMVRYVDQIEGIFDQYNAIAIAYGKEQFQVELGDNGDFIVTTDLADGSWTLPDDLWRVIANMTYRSFGRQDSKDALWLISDLKEVERDMQADDLL